MYRHIVKTEAKAIDESGNVVPAFYSYVCNGPNMICPLFNSGSGTPFIVCGLKGSGDKGPAFTDPGSKPGGCKYQGLLNFDGWVLSEVRMIDRHHVFLKKPPKELGQNLMM